MDTEKMSAIERLEELLDEKDAEINNLQNELDKINKDTEWSWIQHQPFDADPYPQLPTPRLQMKAVKMGDSWYNRFWEYGIVYPAFWGTTVFIPLGGTKQSGGGGTDLPIRFSEPEIPFRDGVHIYHDMTTFNLPAYVIVEGNIWILEIQEPDTKGGKSKHATRQIQ